MRPLPSVHKIEQKAYRGSEQDGLVDLLAGLSLSLLAIALQTTLPYFIILVLAPAILFGPVLKSLRRRFTWTRAGYVKLIPENPRKLVGGIFLVMLILFVILAGALFIFGDPTEWGQWVRWLPAFLGILISGMFNSLAAKSGCARYYILAGLSVLGGFTLSILHFESFSGTIIYFLGMGIILLIIGAASFVRFIRTHPMPTQEDS